MSTLLQNNFLLVCASNLTQIQNLIAFSNHVLAKLGQKSLASLGGSYGCELADWLCHKHVRWNKLLKFLVCSLLGPEILQSFSYLKTKLN